MRHARSQGSLAEERDGFRFRGGHTAIDLPTTLAGRLKPTPRELLRTPQDLARWLVAANLASGPIGASEDDLTMARALREAIYHLAASRVSGGADASAARAVLNHMAAQPTAIPQLTADGEVKLTGTAGTLLATLARDAVHLFGGEAADHIRQCQSPVCTLFFIDNSRSGERRWCSMSGCGNRTKVAEFRRRKRLSGETP